MCSTESSEYSVLQLLPIATPSDASTTDLTAVVFFLSTVLLFKELKE